MKVKQKLEGNNNVQVGINYGEVVHTEKLIRRVGSSLTIRCKVAY